MHVVAFYDNGSFTWHQSWGYRDFANFEEAIANYPNFNFHFVNPNCYESEKVSGVYVRILSAPDTAEDYEEDKRRIRSWLECQERG